MGSHPLAAFIYYYQMFVFLLLMVLYVYVNTSKGVLMINIFNIGSEAYPLWDVQYLKSGAQL